MTPEPGREALAAIVAGLEGVTAGPWDVWKETTPSKYDAIAELTSQVQMTDPFVGAVYLINAGGKCPAETGCGPCSEANAYHIARCHPEAIRSIADYVAMVEKERDEAMARSRDYPTLSAKFHDREKSREAEQKFCRDTLARATTAEARAEAAEGRVAVLEEAVKPFNDAADEIEEKYGADLPDWQVQFPELTMKDFRRARAALKRETQNADQ